MTKENYRYFTQKKIHWIFPIVSNYFQIRMRVMPAIQIPKIIEIVLQLQFAENKNYWNSIFAHEQSQTG